MFSRCWWVPGHDAITLGPVICFRARRAEIPTGLLAHEWVHVEQFNRLGAARFIWRYLTGSLRGYSRNPLEIEAYARGPEVAASPAFQALASVVRGGVDLTRGTR